MNGRETVFTADGKQAPLTRRVEAHAVAQRGPVVAQDLARPAVVRGVRFQAHGLDARACGADARTRLTEKSCRPRLRFGRYM